MRVALNLLALVIAFSARVPAQTCSSSCIDSCYFATIPQTGCPNSADPEAPATQVYINCVCLTFNAPAYLFCLEQHCGASTATPIEGVFAGWCAFNGGIGPQPCGAAFNSNATIKPAAIDGPVDASGRPVVGASA